LNPEAAIEVRAATEADLEEIWRIQSACDQAAQWKAGDYLKHQCLIATIGGRAAGFAVSRRTAADEMEIFVSDKDKILLRDML